MDIKIIVAIIGVLGLLLVSFLSSIGYFYRERCRKIRIINQNIFYLLKMLHIALALKNIGRFGEKYSEKLKSHKKLKDLIQDDDNILSKKCNELLTASISPIAQKVNEDFKKKFNDSIYELSKVRPVVAYKLSKTSYTEELAQHCGQILQDTSAQANQNKEYMDGFKDGVEASQKHVLSELESKLIKAIKSISWSSSFQIWISCRYEILALKKKYSENKMNKYLDDYIETTILPLMNKQSNMKKG
jgi:hypothetical protein